MTGLTADLAEVAPGAFSAESKASQCTARRSNLPLGQKKIVAEL